MVRVQEKRDRPAQPRHAVPHDAAGIDRTSLELSRSGVVDLDTDKRAAMASNLMVSLTSEHAVTPVINTGTLYQG